MVKGQLITELIILKAATPVFGIVQISVSVSKKGFGPGTILGPENEPEDWAWNETKQGSIIKVLCIGVSKFSNEFLLDS